MTAEGSSPTSRSEAWHNVWDRRDPEKLAYDGYEHQVASYFELERMQAARAAFISATLDLNREDHLLDLGCGTAALTSRLAPLVRRVTAVDYSQDALALARERLKSFGAEVVHADIAAFASAGTACTKALAVSSMHYLDSHDVLRHILFTLSRKQGVPVLVMDIPDAAFASGVKRDYDSELWSHLTVDSDQIQDEFPGSTVYRGLFPRYANDPVRFSILIPAALGRVP